MRAFFSDSKTIIVEIIGCIGGFLWAKNSKWDYEPVILLLASASALLFSVYTTIQKRKSIPIPIPEKSPIIQKNMALIAKEDLHISHSTKTSSSTTQSLITPKEIQDTIKAAPLFQQENIAKNYVGFTVQWHLNLFTIHTRTGANIGVTAESSLITGLLWINFNINTEEYPFFKIAKKGTKMLVIGKIISCDTFTIQLEVSNVTQE